MSKAPPNRSRVLAVVAETIEHGPSGYRLPDFLASIDRSVAVRPSRILMMAASES